MAASFAIRIGRTNDLASVEQLARAFCVDGDYRWNAEVRLPAIIELLANRDHGLILLAFLGSDPVGYLALTWGFSIEAGGCEGLVDELYVMPSSRGRGLAGRLLETAADEGRAGGASRLVLETELDNEGARRLYRRVGFRDGDSIWMERWLDQRLGDDLAQ